MKYENLPFVALLRNWKILADVKFSCTKITTPNKNTNNNMKNGTVFRVKPLPVSTRCSDLTIHALEEKASCSFP